MRKWKLVAVAMVPLVSLLAYTAAIVHIGQSRTSELISYAAELEHSGITPNDFPPGWLDELVRVEDPGFYDHNGIDFSSPGAGLTTLTQGLVKIHYFKNFQPGFAKYKQSILALVLDRRLPKQSQLILILNTVHCS
jgi:membrane carboxypeptidase/penicillin-binding protein